ncbi:extracellular solute-binding protein [Actinoplanes sp. CA-030573]|uniref:extracellular solute-binding protein n=1 Tax=Actinoplanes sp. CA-030573 TaxID=3239898 RepID=UPI003D94E8CF
MRLRPTRDFVLGFVSAAVMVSGVFLVASRGGEPELEPGPLTVLSGRDDSAGGQRQQLVDIWNAAHPHNPARIIPINGVAGDQYTEMLAQARNPGIDVFNLDVTLTAAFAAGPDPLIRPIERSWLAESPEQAFMAGPLSTCRYEGKLWALPFNTDAGLLYYRKGLGAEPPFDWAKIKATAARHPEFRAAYTAQLGPYEGLTVNTLEAVWANGGDLSVGPDGTVRLDLATWNAAVHTLIPPRDGEKGIVHPDALRSQESESTSTFADGSVMFMRNWPVAYGALEKIGFGVTALPGPSVLGGQNLAISALTKKPRAAQALAEFLTSAGSQRVLFDKGGFAATRAGVYADETVKADRPYAPLLLTAIESARPRPISRNYVAFSETLSREVHAVLDGTQPDLPPDLAASLTQALRGR